MKSLICLSLLLAVAYAKPYNFGYVTADGQMRQESGIGGAVSGSYSYIDPNGFERKVSYVADAFGYRPIGDVTVDKMTAARASALAAVAPAGTVPVEHAKIVAPVVAAPVAKLETIGHYVAPVAKVETIKYAAPVAKIETVLPYTAPLTSYVHTAPLAKVADWTVPYKFVV